METVPESDALDRYESSSPERPVAKTANRRSLIRDRWGTSLSSLDVSGESARRVSMSGESPKHTRVTRNLAASSIAALSTAASLANRKSAEAKSKGHISTCLEVKDGGTVDDIRKFQYVHQTEASEAADAESEEARETSLGGRLGVVPMLQPGDTVRIYVSELIFHRGVRGQTIRIQSNPREGEDATGNHSTNIDSTASKEYDVLGKTACSKGKLVLKDVGGNPFAVIAKRPIRYDVRYDIYAVEPVSPHQKPSNLKIHELKGQENDNLYLWSRVVSSIKGKVSIDMYSGQYGLKTDVYKVEKLKMGFFKAKTTVVSKQGRAAALVKQGTFPDGVQGPAWEGVIGPGIDPCLMVCLIAILDDTKQV